MYVEVANLTEKGGEKEKEKLNVENCVFIGVFYVTSLSSLRRDSIL